MKTTATATSGSITHGKRAAYHFAGGLASGKHATTPKASITAI